MTLPENDPSLGVNHELERLMLGDHKIKPKKFIVLNYADLLILQSVIEKISDAIHDSPKRVGIGKHVKNNLIVTAKHGNPIKHPTMDLWAYPVDDVLRKLWKSYQDDKMPKRIADIMNTLTPEQKSVIGNAIRNAGDMDSSWTLGSGTMFQR